LPFGAGQWCDVQYEFCFNYKNSTLRCLGPSLNTFLMPS
jgi:hypothetical protein